MDLLYDQVRNLLLIAAQAFDKITSSGTTELATSIVIATILGAIGLLAARRFKH